MTDRYVGFDKRAKSLPMTTVQTAYTGPATETALQAAVSSWPEARDRVLRLLADAEATAKGVYSQFGLPTEPGRYVQLDPLGPWEPSDCIVNLGNAKPRRWPDIGGDHPRESAVGYARAILVRVGHMRNAFAAGRYSDFEAANQMVVLHRDLVVLTFGYGAHGAFGVGLKQRDGAINGGNQAAAQQRPLVNSRHSRWQELANEYWVRHVNASKLQVAHHVAKACGVSWETVRKNIERRS